MDAVKTTEVNGVRKEVKKGSITLDRIYAAEFQKPGTLTAQIRQIISTKSHYPEKKVTSNLQAGLFATQEFGFSEQVFESDEVRVAWIPVPENANETDVKARIEFATKNGACIYKILSNQPILDENQKYAISQNLRTVDDFANTQVVRYPENEETIANGTAGTLTLDKAGNVQYRRTFFWATAQEDHDVRGKGEVYLSAEIKAELAGASVLQGQTI